jgi:hypothetical protein
VASVLKLTGSAGIRKSSPILNNGRAFYITYIWFIYVDFSIESLIY